MVAKFAGQFLPSTIGGDAVRAYDTWKRGASKSIAISAIIVDRLVGLLVLVLFAVVAVCFPHELTRRFPAVYYWVAIGTASLAACLWFVFAPSARLVSAAKKLAARSPERVRLFLERTLVALTVYRGHTGALIRALLLSMLLQVNVVTFYYFIGRSIGLDISYGLFYLIVPIAVFVMLAPVSVNGIGVRESIFVLLLGTYSVDDAHAVAFAWLEYGIFLLYGVFGGIVYVFRKSFAADSPIASQVTGPLLNGGSKGDASSSVAAMRSFNAAIGPRDASCNANRR